MTRRYISIAEAAEYLNVSDRTVRRLIADGELTGYRAGRSSRLIRLDLDEIDEKLMQPIGFHWDDPSARPRKRESRRVPDRSAAVERTAAVEKITGPKPQPPEAKRASLDDTYKRWCKCGCSADAHGLRTTIEPGTINPPKIGVCWVCECNEFVEEVERRKPRRRRGGQEKAR